MKEILERIVSILDDLTYEIGSVQFQATGYVNTEYIKEEIKNLKQIVEELK